MTEFAAHTAPDIVTEKNPFTHYYAQLLHQGNMLADHVRTSTYQQAFLENAADFKDKVVLDVGTGTGILAFFAVQAGARKVYAVEASDSADIAEKISKANGYDDKVVIVKGKLEEITLPEKVDIIISEPIGFLLVHERMLESYAFARKHFLKPGGLMLPSTGSIVLAPITDAALHAEQAAKTVFWDNADFYGGSALRHALGPRRVLLAADCGVFPRLRSHLTQPDGAHCGLWGRRGGRAAQVHHRLRVSHRQDVHHAWHRWLV